MLKLLLVAFLDVVDEVLIPVLGTLEGPPGDRQQTKDGSTPGVNPLGVMEEGKDDLDGTHSSLAAPYTCDHMFTEFLECGHRRKVPLYSLQHTRD